MVFRDVEKLKTFLLNDIKVKDLSPVRFINIETMDMWITIKKIISQTGAAHMNISSYCESEDTTPNINRLKNDLKRVTKNTLITPLSEHLRVNNPSALKTFNDILNLDFINNNDNRLKVYIPLYRMREFLQNINLNERNINSIIFLETDADCDYSLTIIQNTLNAKIQGNEITGYRKYLTYWEQNPDKPIILHTQNAIYYADVVFSDDVKVIVSAFDLLKHHHSLPAVFTREDGLDEHWQMLLELHNSKKTLDNIMEKKFSVSRFDFKILSNWSKLAQFDQWLIWLWAKLKSQDGYLKIVLKDSMSVNDFEILVTTSIKGLIDDMNYYKYYLERLELLKIMKISLTNDFWNSISNLSTLNKLKCLTNNSDREKEEIILLINAVPLNEEVIKLLNLIYKELALYLSPCEFYNQRVSSYMTQYKKQKIKNQVDNDFLLLVNQIAQEKCEILWQLSSRNVLVNELYNDESVVFFVDALGVEYIQVLCELLNKSNVNVNTQIGYCNIPSKTSLNKDFYESRKNEKFYELDQLKHGNLEFPKNIVKEFEILNKITTKAIELLEKNKRVIIASDHGTSRLAILAKGETLKAKEEAATYKFGRYCIDEVNDYSSYQGCINKDEYWIFANYDRFSSPGAPLMETHGGASLEECIVPVICIEKPFSEKIVYEKLPKIIVKIVQNEIKISPNKKLRVEFTLSQQLPLVEAVVNNKRYICNCEDGIYWFEPDIGKDEKYNAKIVYKEIIGEIHYKIIKGISSKFDI